MVIDGGILQTFALTALSSVLVGEIIKESIEFRFIGDNAGARRDYYVGGFGAPVPLPAALPMMIMGLLGLFGFRKVTA